MAPEIQEPPLLSASSDAQLTHLANAVEIITFHFQGGRSFLESPGAAFLWLPLFLKVDVYCVKV